MAEMKMKMAGSSQLLAILMSMLRRSLEAAWNMARVWIEYAYTHRTGGQTPCADVIVPANRQKGSFLIVES